MPFTRYTLGSLRTALADRYDANPFWSEDDADDAINTALRIYNLLTGTWQTRVIVPLVANRATYSVQGTAPVSLTAASRVAISERPLEVSAFSDLRLARPGWAGETTASGGDVPDTPTVWCPWGLAGIVLWPAPGTAFSTQHATVDGVADTPVLAAGSDYLDMDDGEVGDLLDLALSFTALRPGGSTFADLRPRFVRALTAISTRMGRRRATTAFLTALTGDRDRTFVSRALAQRDPYRPLPQDALLKGGEGA